MCVRDYLTRLNNIHFFVHLITFDAQLTSEKENDGHAFMHFCKAKDDSNNWIYLKTNSKHKLIQVVE